MVALWHPEWLVTTAGRRSGAAALAIL